MAHCWSSPLPGGYGFETLRRNLARHTPLITEPGCRRCAGQQGWVAAMRTADEDVCDVKVTATGTGVAVDYPANTDTFSSLYVNTALATGNFDYTASTSPSPPPPRPGQADPRRDLHRPPARADQKDPTT